MPTVAVTSPHHRYDAVIDPDSLGSLGGLAREAAPHDSCLLVTDDNVGKLYGSRAAASLAGEGFAVRRIDIAPGEPSKTLDTMRELYRFAATNRLERGAPVVALGGGVVGDTAGFFAATWMRGVPLVHVPTTLLAMVDASIGGKVGVNLPEGKNLVGAFHPPALVVIDPKTLATLPERELRCGLAECVKHAVVRDESLFRYIHDNLPQVLACQPATLTELIRRNVAIKAAIVAEDERESGVRAHLNLGHTFAHAIESATGYDRFLHGEAVALGMVAAANLARELNLCGPEVPERVAAICVKLGLPVRVALPGVEELVEAMMGDKKVKGGRLRLVLPERIGSVVVRDDVPREKIVAAWESIRTK